MKPSFETYQPPALDQVFTADCKKEVLSQKLRNIARDTERHLLIGDMLIDLIEDQTDRCFTSQIDCLNMIKIGFLKTKDDFMRGFEFATRHGITAALCNSEYIEDGTNFSLTRVQSQAILLTPSSIMVNYIISEVEN